MCFKFHQQLKSNLDVPVEDFKCQDNKCYSLTWIDSTIEVGTTASLSVRADITVLKDMT